MSSKHSPTPWATRPHFSADVIDADGNSVLFDEQEGYENAAHIVKCVNAHDDLVAVVKEAMANILSDDHPKLFAAMAAALTKAGAL